MAGVTTFNIYFNGDAGDQPGTSTDPQQEGTPDPNNPTKPKSGGIKQMAGFAIAKQMGKSLLNFATSQVGDITGSSNTQDKVSFGMKAAGTVAAIIANPAMGIAMAALDLATSAWEAARKMERENRVTQQARYRAGPSLNQSRMGN